MHSLVTGTGVACQRQNATAYSAPNQSPKQSFYSSGASSVVSQGSFFGLAIAVAGMLALTV
jgi:hypothetical protein